jgi:hypothetical protein
VPYNFHTGNNRIKLLTEYGSLTQKYPLPDIQYCRTLNNFNMPAFSGTSGLKITGHGNPDNNLESFCTFKMG